MKKASPCGEAFLTLYRFFLLQEDRLFIVFLAAG